MIRRLIPAHAGKTTSSFASPTTRRAHPRSRGENGGMSYRIDWIQGSSPLTRGKHRLPLAAYRACGLIPAHAGKTTYDGDPTMTAQAHPRSRGENPELRVCLRRVRGSSPLTRGKHARGSRAAADPGLIPAHAGKTEIEPIGQAIGRE